MDEAWSKFRDRLRAEVAGMREGDTLVVFEPDPEPAPVPDAPGRRWWQRRPKSRPETGRYVQFMRWHDGFSAECVSLAYRKMTEAQKQWLLSLGWSDPDSHPPGGGRSENHEMWFGLDEVERLAQISTDSLRVLGEEPPDAQWTWRKDPPA
ncbi:MULTISPECIES: TY-Chap domain-containing protein [Streptomyces]